MSSVYPEIEILVTDKAAVTAGFQNAVRSHAGLATPGVEVTPPAAGATTFVDPKPPVFNTDGHKEPTYFDDLYFKIHVTPSVIDLGNILSVQTRQLKVWNAHFVTKTMSQYSEPLAQGLEITEPVTAPYDLAGLEELTYTITVGTKGPVRVNDVISWTIDGDEYEAVITGQRVVVFPFGPNWDQPMVEVLEWKTDVFTAFDGSETREPLRSKPRRRLGYQLTLHGNELNQFQNLLFGWQDRKYALPLWQDKWLLQQAVSQGQTSVPVDTFSRGFFEGGLAVLMKDTYEYEVFEIETVEANNLVASKALENDWPVNTRVYPMNLAMLPTSVATDRITSKVNRAMVEFTMDPVTTDPNVPDTPAVETLDGYEVILRKPNWSTPVQYESEADLEILDHDIGAISQSQKPSFPRQNRRVNWLLKSRSDIMDFKGLLGRMKGQYTAAYVPTWFPDFELSETAGVGSSSLRVIRSRYDLMVGVADTQKTLLIRLRDGTKLFREIIGTTQPETGVEQLNIDEPLPVEVSRENTLMISLVHLCRLRQDGVTINHQSNSVATVEINMTTVRS